MREIVGVKGEDNKEGKVINNYTYIGNGEMDRKRNESKHVKRVCTGKQRYKRGKRRHSALNGGHKKDKAMWANRGWLAHSLATVLNHTIHC